MPSVLQKLVSASERIEWRCFSRFGLGGPRGLATAGLRPCRVHGPLRMSPTMIAMPSSTCFQPGKFARFGTERFTCLKNLCQSSDVVHRLTSATKMPRCLRAAR